MNGEEEPVKDIDDIPDNQSEVSSIMSSRTEYHELPTRSTILNSTGMSGKEGFPLSDLGHSKTLGKYDHKCTCTCMQQGCHLISDFKLLGICNYTVGVGKRTA